MTLSARDWCRPGRNWIADPAGSREGSERGDDDEQRDPDGRGRRLQREGRRQGNHLRGAGGGAGFGRAQEARRGPGMCASPSTARPATTRPSAAGRCSPTTRARSRTSTREIRLEDALDLDKDAVVGGFVEEPMESAAFGRIAAQQAKQVIVQKVREAERAQVVDQYKDRVNTLVSGDGQAHRPQRHLRRPGRQRRGLRAAHAT